MLRVNLLNSCQRRHLIVSFTDLLACALRCGIAWTAIERSHFPFAVQTLIEYNQRWAVSKLFLPAYSLSLGSPEWINPGLCRSPELWPLTLCDRIKAETFCTCETLSSLLPHYRGLWNRHLQLQGWGPGGSRILSYGGTGSGLLPPLGGGISSEG